MKQHKITSWAALAKRLSVSRRSLLDWRRKPGAPPTPDVEAWEEFVEANSLGIASTRLSPEREKLMCQMLRAKTHGIELQNAERENRMIEVSAINEFLLHVGTLLKTVWYRELENDLPPRLAGKTAPEMSIIGRETADRLCDIFSTELDQWISMLPPPKTAKPGTAG